MCSFVEVLFAFAHHTSLLLSAYAKAAVLIIDYCNKYSIIYRNKAFVLFELLKTKGAKFGVTQEEYNNSVLLYFLFMNLYRKKVV